MNLTQSTWIVLTLGTAIVGWHFWQSEASFQEGGDPLQELAENEQPEFQTNEQAAVTPARQSSSDAADFTTVTPPDFAQLIRENPRCRVSGQHPDVRTGELRDAYSCVPEGREPHPYEVWSEEVLAGLAYGDAKAAEVLGLRHINSEDPNREAIGLMLLYRSVALSGNTEALHRAVGDRYAYVSINGEPQIENLKQLLVFALIANRLGDDTIRSKSVEARLLRESVASTEIQLAHQQAVEILGHMATTQREITGNTNIEEALADV